MIDLHDLIEQANEPAPLPASTVRLAELVSDPDSQLNDVAELIAFDQGLTLKLLRAANSAASASAEPVGTVLEAVGRMGTSQVLALAEELEPTVALAEIHPEDCPRVSEAVRARLADGIGRITSFRIQERDGSWRTIESSNTVIASADGEEAAQFLIVGRDITERKQVEDELTGRSELLQEL